MSEEPRLDLFQFPEFTQGSMVGSEFGNSIVHMRNTSARELTIYQQLELGNIPSFLRRGLPISVVAGEHHGVFWTMPDYLAVGSNDDFLRMPMRPTTAEKAAALYGAVLPTRKMVNDIWRAMPIHLEPKPHGTKDMASVPTFMGHNKIIQAQLGGRLPELGVDGHKKTVVVAKGRAKKNVAIYGWHYPSGKPIQGPQIQKSAHTEDYLDYSHGIRWVSDIMLVDGSLMYVRDVLTHPDLHELVSDEGQYAPGDVSYVTE